MTSFLVSMLTMAALAGALLGTGDRIRLQDPDQDRLRDGSCKTSTLIIPAPTIPSSTIFNS